jgi:short subunit fatty acids transporter
MPASSAHPPTKIQTTLRALIRVANQDTFNPTTTCSFILIFIPSGGAWAVSAVRWKPQKALHAPRLTIRPTTRPDLEPAQPVLHAPVTESSTRARDLAGYSILQLLFHTPLVLIYCWAMAYTPGDHESQSRKGLKERDRSP